jgi:MFS family permease
MPFPTGLRALNHRDFRVFWTGQCISLVGRWMQAIGQSWLVLELTNSPLRLGIVNSLQFAPLLLLSFPAGALADRLPKRPLLIGTQLALMFPALAIAALIWIGAIQYWHVVVMATVIGVANALDMPARQSMVGELVGKDDLMNAIALNSAVFNAARMVGPAAGGLLIARSGVALAFFLNGVTFLAVVAALLAMRAEATKSADPGTRLARDIADGLRYATREPRISLVLSLILAVSIFVINHNVLVPLVARDLLGEEVQGFGFLMATLGAGALIGAATLAQFGRGRPALAAVIVPAIVVSTGILSLAAVRQFWLAAIVLFLTGVAQILFLTSSNTTLQVTAPDALRGRVMALYALVFAGVSPIGAFLTGSIAEAFGSATACAVGGGLGLASVLALSLRWIRTTDTRAKERPS